MEVVKKISIILGITVGILAIYFGSYLPFSKAQRYISLLNSPGSGSPQSLERVLAEIDKVIKSHSPVGQEENVRYILNDILNVIIQTQQSEAVDKIIVEYVEPHALKNDIRHTLVMGEIYRALWEKYDREIYYEKAEDYYAKSLALAPRLPQLLNSMFGFYKAAGDTEKMKEIGGQILKYWPDNDSVREQIKGI